MARRSSNPPISARWGPWVALGLQLGCKGEPEPAPPREIFFGDLHVHSTNSVDVFALKLPLFGHLGRVSPMDHCHFARYCSQLDFWAITDHQEGAPPWAWDESVEAVTQCNARYGGDSDTPELVTFAGFEWQQSTQDPATDWGHKNVIFPGSSASRLPRRAIASADQVTAIDVEAIEAAVTIATQLDPENRDIYAEVGEYAVAGATAPSCAEGVPTRDLPADCVESASAPFDLYDKLDQWGFPALVIPHGTTWGAHHPPLMSWEHQLDPTHHRPEYQSLLEIYSGHGSIEEYRSFRSASDDGGTLRCVDPVEGYEPCCWRAGEIARAHDPTCVAEPGGEACEAVVVAARQAFLDAGRQGFLTRPEAAAEEWLDCDECRDCFQPAEGYRPLGSAQAALAMSHFDGDRPDLRYQFGFLGSTDTHAVGPGAGFKEGRIWSDIMGPAKLEWAPIVGLMVEELFPNWERQNSFFHSGGLVAVHAAGPSREAIWKALEDRAVYATTGERIELWFDLVGGGEPTSMGGESVVSTEPRFRVRAKGSPIQEPGCPAGVPEDVVRGACFGECYNPTPGRHALDRVEVVRIRPQVTPGEELAGLIDDPLVVLPCGGGTTCEVEFTDPEFVGAGRDALYYVEVVQLPTGQLNHEDLRCERDGEGNCLSVRICEGGVLGEGDDCIQEGGERAWASPILLRPG